MTLVEIHDQKTWDSFVSAQPRASFQQSWAWGDFQISQGHPVKRFIFDDALACQLIYYKRRFSGYWFAPRGPVFAQTPPQGSNTSPALLREEGVLSGRRALFSSFLTDLLSQNLPGPALFYRFEPPLSIKDAENLMPMRMRRNHAMSPATTALIDLTKTEDDLLAAMHPKTRYNIRVAEKHGITVREDAWPEDIDAFLKLMQETGERDAFTPLSLSYLRSTFESLKIEGVTRLFIAEANGKVLAASMVMAFGDTMTYLHGASSSKSREMMAPYALHWAAICQAKREGFKYYDLWGCNPEQKSSFYYKPSWEGITRFKEGWGGERINLTGTWDLPMNRILYRLAFPGGIWRG